MCFGINIFYSSHFSWQIEIKLQVFGADNKVATEVVFNLDHITKVEIISFTMLAVNVILIYLTSLLVYLKFSW